MRKCSNRLRGEFVRALDEEAGERFFSPDVVERLQQLIREGRPPSRVIETLVIDFAA